jgi:ankyrin repeat protein
MDPRVQAAARTGDVAVVSAFLAGGGDVNALDRYGQTALMLAARGGHREVVERLLAAGARLDVTAKFGLSALMLAVVGSHVAVARAIARAGADRTITGRGAPGFAGRTAADFARGLGLHELAAELDPG